MKLNKNQRQIMRGLLTGNKHMSATEAADTDVHELIGEHFVHIWSTMGGFAAWRLTPAGLAALETEDD